MKQNFPNVKITPEGVLKGLKTRIFGRSLLCLEKTTSTNDVILELARQGALEGTTVTTDIQTHGRGRQGSRWIQCEGKGLAFSILLRPKLDLDELPEITLAAGVAMAKTLESFRLKPQIKWPNDLLLDGLKVCGILTEMGPKKDKITPVVLGIGINLNQTKKDFPRELRGIATSVYLFTGRKVNRVKFLQMLLSNLEESYHWVVDRHFSKVLGEWGKRSITLHSQVNVTQGHHVFFGQVIGIDEKGALLVRNDNGVVERVTSGDVDVVPINRGKRL